VKIERIRTYHLRAELTPAEAFAYSQAHVGIRTAMLVEIVADDGRSGWGEAYGPPAPSKTVVDELYAPRLIGRDPMDTTVIWEALYAAMRDYGRSGFPVAALSAVDIALWDLKGITLGQPVAKLLGGAFRTQLTAYATGLYRHDVPDHAAALAAEARGYVADGFGAMKLTPREHAVGGLAAAESFRADPGRAVVRARQDGQSLPRGPGRRAAQARRCYHRGPSAARTRPRGKPRHARALRSHDRRDEAMRLGGKVAVVTGGGAGIGRGIVLCMAKEGADIASPDIQDANAQSVVKEVLALGRKAVSMRCDVTKAADVKASFDRIKKELGKIDILVNNAGMASVPGMPFTNNSEEDWDKTYAVNLKSVFLTCKEIAPYMMERKSGRIINIASIAGPLAAQTMPPYSVAKGGVITFTRVLAKDLAAHGITVNAICPGVLWTAFWENLAQYIADTNPAFKGMTARQVFDKRINDVIPLKREQTPEDIGWAATFLASDEARNITGQALNVDGGSVMH